MAVNTIMSIDIDKLKEAVKNSKSWRGVLMLLGRSTSSGTAFYRIKKQVQDLEIDCSHFTGQAHNKGKTGKDSAGGYAYEDASSYLANNGRRIPSYALKNKLFYEGLKQRECEACGLSEWMNALIPLELDHINGDKYDNRIENLRILCPNCHAQTPTYRGKNINPGALLCRKSDTEFIAALCESKSIREALLRLKMAPYGSNYVRAKRLLSEKRATLLEYKEVRGIRLCACGTPINYGHSRCHPCYAFSIRKVTRPSNDDLKAMVWEKPVSIIAKELGVSDKAIAKWCKNAGIETPPRGYWAKVRAQALKSLPLPAK